MASSQNCDNLSKNVNDIRRKLLKTEQTIHHLEQLTLRDQSYDGISNSSIPSQAHDETSSLPPPLTIEELMLESTLSPFSSDTEFVVPANKSVTNISEKSDSSSKTTEINQRNRNSSSNDFSRTLSAIPITEHTLSDVPTSFRLVKPNATELSPNSRFSASPSKVATQLSFSTPKKFHTRFSSFPKDQSPDRPQSSAGIFCRQFEPEFRGRSTNSEHSNYGATVTKNDWDVTLPSEILEDSIYGEDSSGEPRDMSPQRPISARSNATSVTLLGADAEVEKLKEKFSSVRSDNARLRTLVTQLRNQMEEKEDSAIIRTQHLPAHISEQIITLLDQLKVNENTLRKTEDKLQYKENVSRKKDRYISELKNQTTQLQELLKLSNQQKLHVEVERKTALKNAAHLTQQLDESQFKMSLQASESQRRLNDELRKAGIEQSEIMKQNDNMKRENEELQKNVKALQCSLSAVECKFREQDVDGAKTLDHAQQQIRELVQELESKHSKLKKQSSDMSALEKQHQYLKEQLKLTKNQNICQKDLLVSCQKENEVTKAQVELMQAKINHLKQEASSSLSNTTITSQRILSDRTNSSNADIDADSSVSQISTRKHKSAISELNMKLATKEAHIKRLEVRISGYVNESEKLETLHEELIAYKEKARTGDRRINELEDVVHLMEEERTKYLKKVNDLEDHMQDISKERDSLECRLKERTSSLSHYQAQVEELMLKVSDLEKEKSRRKEENNKVTNQLSEENEANSSLKDKIKELQALVLEKTRELDTATEYSGKQETDVRREMKKMKKTHQEQCQELSEQIESTQEECNKYKNHSMSAKQQLLFLNEQILVKQNRNQELENLINVMRKQEDTNTESHEEALQILEAKSSSSSCRVISLEGALAQCKNEIATYIEQLHEAHNNFTHQVAVKSDQLAKVENEFKLLNSSLEDEIKRTAELEKALEERHKMLEDAASRIAELEESQSNLQSQASKLEQKLSRENIKSDHVIQEMDGKLKVACQELEAKNQQFAQLNDILERVDEDFTECKSQLAKLEQQTHELHMESEVKAQELERARFEWKEMKSKLDSGIERVAALEEEVQNLDRDNKKYLEKCLNLETEVTQLKAQSEDVMQHNSQLQSYSQNRNADVLNKESVISKLKENLMISEENRKKSEEEARNSGRLLEERQWQLQQRAAQLTQLDMQVKELRSGTEKRNNSLAKQLDDAQIQLKERTEQISSLDCQLTTLREEFKETRHLLEEKQQNIRILEREIEKKSARIDDLEKSNEAERKAREERHKACIDASQEMRVAREREQKMCRELQESKRELGRILREQQQLLSDMHEMGSNNHEKDERLNRLSQQVSTLACDKISVEAKYREELDRTQRDIQKMREEYQQELDHFKLANSQLLIKSRVTTGNQEFEINSVLEREREARDETHQVKESLVIMERELLARRQVIDAANDTIVVKDAEIARLEAKLSGVERGVAMASVTNTPVKLAEQDQQRISSPSVPVSNQITDHFRQSSKQEWAHESTNTSIFTGLESDVGSFAPSFVPIAVSTRRHPSEQRRQNSSSFFLTSSPTPDQDYVINSDLSTEEDSLYKRVFADTVQYPSILEAASHSDVNQKDLYPGRESKRALTKSIDLEVNEMKPENCMANLQERLRASEKRRHEVSTKLRHLKKTTF